VLYLGLAAAGLAGFSLTASAQAQSSECELNVWGAVPSYPSNSRFAGPAAIKGTPSADRGDPVANINVLDPLQRLDAVSDDVFQRLLPDIQIVKVVRHKKPIDVKLAKSTKKQISISAAGCYADFALLELYDIAGPVESQGLLPDLLRAPNGMHATYVLRRFDSSGKMTSQTKDSFVAPLRIERANWGQDKLKAVAAINESIIAGIMRFATSFELRGKKKK
jgi:hypothetical protein